MSSELQFCYINKNGHIQPVKKGETIFLFPRYGIEFFVNESCVGRDHKNKKSIVQNAKWAFIYNSLFEDIQTKEDQPNNLWGNMSGGTDNITKYGIGKNYSIGSRITFSPNGETYYYGFKQRVELFSEIPGDGFYFYVVPVSKSNIQYAYFNKSETVRRYGESIKLEVVFHGYNLDKQHKYKAKIYLLEEGEAKGLSTTEDLEEKNLWKDPLDVAISHEPAKNNNYNSYFIHNFNIDIEWKKDSNEKKNFTVAVEIYQAYQKSHLIRKDTEEWKLRESRNFADKPTTDLVLYDSKILELKDLDNKNSISSRFMVSEELMDHYITRVEQEKTNMIQYIGDIRYSKKENDPCGYSKILIQEVGNKNRKSVIIFDENSTEKPIDRTENVFAIIAGDAKKEISILLDNLKTKNVFCQGLLLDEGQKHTDRKNVFQVDNVYAAVRSKLGFHTENDNHHQEQLKNAGLYSQTRKDEKDSDVIKSDTFYDPSEAQNWKEDIDYKFESDHKITLMLNYLYNKTYENIFQKLLGYTADAINSVAYTEIQSTAWVVRYMFLLEKYKQTFFVPISTCRYPNQIIKIEVYPDFEWWINVKFETESPLAVTQAVNYQKRLFTTERNQNQRVAEARHSERRKNWKYRDKKYELKIDAGYKLNGKDHPLVPGDGFPLFKAIKFFLKTYELVRALSFADEAEDTEHSIGIGAERASDGREPQRRMTERWRNRKAKNLPFRIELSMPSLSGGIYGNFAKSKTMPESLGAFYKLAFAAKPLFAVKGELDLLYYAQFIGPIGQAMHRISQVVKKVNYLTLGAVRIDYFIYVGFTVDVNVELKALEYHSIDGWDGGEIQIDLPITIYIRSGVDINVSIQGVGSGKAEGEIKGEMKLESRITYDKRENKGPALLKFDGLSAKIWVKLKTSTDRSQQTPDENNEPDYIRSIIDPKDPWEIDIFKTDN